MHHKRLKISRMELYHQLTWLLSCTASFPLNTSIVFHTPFAHFLSLIRPFVFLYPSLLHPSSPLVYLSIISIHRPPSRRPCALTYSSRSAAAVTSGQEVKAKVERHTHRVTAMPGCCVFLWMGSSVCQTRWRAPDALTFAWACPFPSRGQHRGPAPPIPPGHHCK